MTLTEFAKPSAKSVMGIDTSTKSIAFATIEGGRVTRTGEITLTGDNFYDRLIDCRAKCDVILGPIEVDYIGVEKAIMVKSKDVALKTSMIVGVVISSLATDSTTIEEVAPISWQSYIGNPNITGNRKKEIAAGFPDKSATWINNHIRDMRKKITMDWANNKYGLTITSDNVSDAVGIGTYVAEQRVT